MKNMEYREEKNEFYKKENWVISLGVLVIVVAISTPFLILYKLGWNITYSQFQDLGVVGDFFGGTTVGLFTLASIIFVTAAIVMQKKELELQRKELSQTREEFKIGNDTVKVQLIDNAFFNMLSLHHQIVNNIKIVKGNITYSGREAIFRLKTEFENEFAKKQFLNENPEKGLASWANNSFTRQTYIDRFFNNQDTIEQIELDEVYKEFHEQYGNDIGHYMRNNYRIVKFIVHNVAENQSEQLQIMRDTGREPIIGDKRYYFGMLRAQWSNAEFELILINSLYRENSKFKNLLLKYDVLDIKESDEKKEKDKYLVLRSFTLKKSMDRFRAYRKLIEIKEQ